MHVVPHWTDVGCGEQVPFVAVMVQLTQLPVHVMLQQTPPERMPLVHCDAIVVAVPLARVATPVRDEPALPPGVADAVNDADFIPPVLGVKVT